VDERAIIERAAAGLGVTPDDVLGRSRRQEVAYARHLAMYLIRRRLDWSLPRIGRFLGRDHTTVLYALRQVGAWAGHRPLGRLRDELLEETRAA
jgi:chromosomal replication initiator protein